MRSTDAKILYTGRHVRLVQKAHWEYAQRTTDRGAVLIVPITDDDHLVLIEQWRLPLDANVIEFPAGLVGDDPQFAGEPLLAAAQRELLEETGYEAKVWEELPTCPTSAGLSSEMVTFFLARGARQVAAGGGDGDEQITVYRVPRSSAADWLAARRSQGVIVAAVVYAGLFFAESAMRGARAS